MPHLVDYFLAALLFLHLPLTSTKREKRNTRIWSIAKRKEKKKKRAKLEYAKSLQRLKTNNKVQLGSL